MSWKYDDVRSALITSGLHPAESTQRTYGKVLSSPQVSITNDLLERNLAAYYIYGSNGEAFLLELTLGNSNEDFLSESKVNFEGLVRKLFATASQHHLPKNWELNSNTTSEHFGYVVKCEKDEVSSPYTVRIFIAAQKELQKGLDIRKQFLSCIVDS